MSNSEDYHVIVQYGVDYAIITDTIFSETSELSLKGRERVWMDY